MQRKLNSSTPPKDPPNLVRDGSAKRTVDAPIKPGMVRQTKGEFGYHHGVTVDDEPNTVKSHTQPIGYHSGMTDKQVIKDGQSPTAGQVLHDAANLGRGQKA